MTLADRHEKATVLTEKFRMAQEIEQQQQKAKIERDAKAKQQSAPYHGSQYDAQKKPRQERSSESGEMSSSSGSDSGSSSNSSSYSEEAS